MVDTKGSFLAGLVLGGIAATLVVSATGRRFLLALGGLTKAEINKQIAKIEKKARGENNTPKKKHK